MRTFVDSSTLIALAKIGELEFLKELFGKVYITKTIEKGLLRYDFPENERIKSAIGDWIISVITSVNVTKFTKYGLDKGEATLFLTPKGNRLIIDELSARRIADIEKREYTELLGLIVGAVESKKVKKKKALDIIHKLVESDFRINALLYRDVLRRISEI
ncbi:MAG: hypothetical protein QMD21_01400 [Candidatus Thermoplasmatota archaeon]|nr:hypothetical protein [Candidatus Thermoplasmatota archaeon]